MSDPRVRRLAELIAEYSIAVGEGDLVMIHGPSLAEPLLAELTGSVVRRGGIPYVRVTLEGVDHAFLTEAQEHQLDWLPPFALDEMNTIDARISIHASWNTRELSGIDPSLMARRSAAVRPVTDRFMRRSADGDLRWCVTAYPCPAFAQDSDMSLSAYEDFVYGAGWLQLDDPVAAWREFGRKLELLTAKLEQVSTIRLLAEDTDLTLGVNGRTWIASQGLRNFPDGEVFTGPVEDETNGEVRFSFPAIIGGREVNGVRLVFENGRVIHSEATSGESYLQQMIAMDDGASVLGELAIGTNYGVTQFTKQILFDEKIGGTCHMALGVGYPDTGSLNKSALHWDMVRDLRSGGEIHADGELVYRDGAFLPSFFEPSLAPPTT